MRIPPIVLTLILLTTPAYASSDDAWATFEARVAKACSDASGLDKAATSPVIAFDDTLGKVATVVTGTFPISDTDGPTATMLCIFDKQTQQTWVDEAPGLNTLYPAAGYQPR